MERTPLIGITLDHDDEQTCYKLSYFYVEAITRAGGAAVLLPFSSRIAPAAQLDVVDGLLLTGGNDLDPSAWGEARHPSAKPADAKREAHERALLAEAERRGIPVLAVCFGMQLMNAYRGGSLVQHLPEVPGTADHSRGDATLSRRHGARVESKSRLAAICGGGQIEVNTSHHQAIGRVGEGLVVSAVAEDGTVEAVEDPTRRMWVGVQWHPERMLEEKRHMALFERLVEEAGNRKKSE
jgi:putative glutamine amidotransferase